MTTKKLAQELLVKYAGLPPAMRHLIHEASKRLMMLDDEVSVFQAERVAVLADLLEPKERGELAKETNVPGNSATETNVGRKKTLFFNQRLLLAYMSEEWNRENGVRECAFSTITYLHANGLIDNEKTLAFLESAAKETEDNNHGQG